MLDEQIEEITDIKETEEIIKKYEEKPKGRNTFTIFLLGMLAGFAWVFIVYALSLGARTLIYKIRMDRNPGVTTSAVPSPSPVVTVPAEESVANEKVLTKIKVLESMLNTYYYEDVDQSALEDGIYEGLMEAVGDPYTCYYNEEAIKKQQEDINGTFKGIGAYLQTDTVKGYPVVSGVMEGSPAEEAGVKEGDYIYKVDGEDVGGYDLTTVVMMVRGDEGTQVELTLIREGEEVVVTPTRREITSETVKYEFVEEDRIAVIDISEFDEITPNQFRDALAKAEADNAEGIMIDLRSNPGGSLAAVVEMCNDILPKGIIVYTEDKNGQKEEFFSDGTHELDKPLVVLINQYSASASEIFSGAVKDYGTGTLVGKTTFGKGIVQRVISLTDGTAVKITVSKYYTPNGINIHGTGIEPDVDVDFDSEKYVDEGIDTQREEGLKILREKIANN